jgi:Uma2 family endonuclease
LEVAPVQTSRILLTYEDYEALPNDGRRYEIHEGELSVTPAPGTGHQRSSGKLYYVLRQYVEAHAGGEVLYAPLDVILSDNTIVQPDLVYLAPDRLSLVSERGIEGPPTLAVEIVSPSTTKIDRSTKFTLYARYGVPYYWILDPAVHSIEAHVLSGESYQLAARVAGSEPVTLPPFLELPLVPASLWP